MSYAGEGPGSVSSQRNPSTISICPDSKRGLRACLVCALVKSWDQFFADGCDNCEAELRLQDNEDNVNRWTTGNYFGLVALMDPEHESWVSRFQHLDGHALGCYAMKVYGNPPQEALEQLPPAMQRECIKRMDEARK